MISIQELKSMLVYSGYVDTKDFEKAVKSAERSGIELTDFLVDNGLIRDEQIGKLIAEYKGYKYIDLRKENISRTVIDIVPENVAREKGVISFFEDEQKIKIGMTNPDDFDLLHDIKKKKNKEVEVYFITKNNLNEGLKYYKKKTKEELREYVALMQDLNNEVDADEKNIKLVDLLIDNAIYYNASDIHIEPRESNIRVRYRVDGILKNMVDLPKKFGKIIISRIKIMAKMKTDDHLTAQDGKMKYSTDGESVDIRVSSVPVVEGENLVLRILSKDDAYTTIADLGFSESDYEKIEKNIRNENGMMLVSGPTGCGKTTTLYEIIKKLNKNEVNIATIEDPVEFNIDGLSQMQVNNKTNLTFANGLRAIVRQDPDIIMIGEVRDLETANIAINSALTGHFVLSSFHAKSACATLPRLIDMGIEPYLISSAINMILSQKLVRKICDKCQYSYSARKDDIEFLKNNKSVIDLITQMTKKNIEDILFFKGDGCEHCGNTGYDNRIGVFEILVITENIKRLINKKASENEILEVAKKEGMTTMVDDGVEKILSGITTIEEIMSIVIE